MLNVQKPKSKSGWKSRVFFLVLLIVLLFIILNFSRGCQKSRRINQEISGLKNEIGQLEKDNLELKELITYFNSTAFLEERARLDLGLKKEGEKVVVLTDLAKKELAEKKTEAAAAEKPRSNPQKWWRYFFQ